MKRIAIAVALATCMAGPLWAQDETAPEAATQEAATAGQAAPEAAAAQPPQMSPEMQAMMQAWEKAGTPGPQHRQLAEHFAGTWTAEQSVWMDPAAPPSKQAGTSVNTVEYGGRHVRMKYDSQFMGQPFQGESMTSYDNTAGKYYSTWVDSMGTAQFAASGDYDPATRTYTFTGEMADPMKPGAMTPIREVIRIVDADHHVFEMYETHDGKEARTMEIAYTRAAD